jgi:4-amino-4-deoxy-L-arabinose transferase-like glycosyltransferase
MKKDSFQSDFKNKDEIFRGQLKINISYFRDDKFDKYFITVIIVLAILFRLILSKFRFAVTSDEVNYLKLGISGALNGPSHVFHPFWSPFYPFVIAIFSKLITHYELVGRLVSIMSGSFVLLPIFYMAKNHFNRRIAYYAVVGLSFYPLLAFYNTNVLTGSLYTLLLTIGIFSGWYVLRVKSWHWLCGILPGLFFGLAYLTRPEGIGLMIVFFGVSLILIIISYFKHQAPKIMIKISMTVIAFLTIAFPYIYYLYEATGEWTISAKGKSLQQGEAYALTRTENDVDRFLLLSDDNTQLYVDQMWHIGNFVKAQNSGGKVAMRVTPLIIMKKYFTNLYQIIKGTIPVIFTTPIFILLILGLLGEAWSRSRIVRELYLFSFIGFFFFLVIPLFHISDRYFYPFFPICFIWVSKGFEQLIIWFQCTIRSMSNIPKALSNRYFTSGIIVLILFFGIYFPQLARIIIRDKWSNDYYADPIGQKMAGLWLKEHTTDRPVIMSKNHAVDFYAGNYNIVESTTIPQNDLDRVLEYAKYRGVSYLVLNDRYKRNYPRIVDLLDEKNVPDNLKLIYKKKDKSELRTLIYKIVDN